MKKKITIIYLFIVCFFMINSPLFAQETDPGNDEGENAESIEDPGAPVNNGILWLAIAGVAFGLYYYSTQRKKQVEE